jgi:uncharacterized membrane protein YhhN
MKRVSLVLFALASAGELLSHVVHQDLLHMVCKPLIMISLLLYYNFASRQNAYPVVNGAIVFSFLGDVLLLSDDNFIYGLGAFLISHVLYTIAYRQHRDDEGDHALTGIHRIRLAFPVVLAGTGLSIVLFPVLDELKVPVLIYAIAITTMVLAALFRLGRTNARSFWMVFGGASLFMISDAILAINKFLTVVGHSSVWIMLTYIAAQFLIISGLIEHHPADHRRQSIH